MRTPGARSRGRPGRSGPACLGRSSLESARGSWSSGLDRARRRGLPSTRSFHAGRHTTSSLFIGSWPIVDVLVCRATCRRSTPAPARPVSGAQVSPFSFSLLAVHVEVGLAQEEQADLVPDAAGLDEAFHRALLRIAASTPACGCGSPRSGEGCRTGLSPSASRGRFTREGSLDPAAPMSGQAHTQSTGPLRRQGHGAERTSTVDREGDVHRPVVAHLAVLAGPVERIHDPHAATSPGARACPRSPPRGCRRRDSVRRTRPWRNPSAAWSSDVGERVAAPSDRSHAIPSASPRGACGEHRELEVCAGPRAVGTGA